MTMKLVQFDSYHEINSSGGIASSRTRRIAVNPMDICAVVPYTDGTLTVTKIVLRGISNDSQDIFVHSCYEDTVRAIDAALAQG
jgi:hypothetical protein